MPAAPSQLFTAIAFKLISALLFAAMWALVRQLSEVAPLGQVVFFRSACAIPPVLLIYALRGELRATLYTRRPLGQLGRGSLAIVGMFTNFAGLARLPLAEATAFNFVSPLFTVALAALILKERVRLFRWTAVAVGFIGVIVMLIPNMSLEHYSAPGIGATAMVGAFLAIFSALCNAGTVIQTRRLTQTETTSSIVFYFSLICALAGAVTLPFAWHSPTASELTGRAGLCRRGHRRRRGPGGDLPRAPARRAARPRSRRAAAAGNLAALRTP
jgi:drug/metabolite transporter (DMT)-like permease